MKAICGLALLAAGCVPPAPRPVCPPAPEARAVSVSVPVPGAAPARAGGSAIEAGHCLVEHVAGHREDAEELAQFVAEATSRATEYFAEIPAEVMWRGVSCRVHQMELPSSLAQGENATIIDGGTRDEFTGDVFLLSVSAYRRTVPPLSKEDLHENRRAIVTHELSTIPLVRATLVKGPGWRFHSAPQWFTQGYEQWFAAFTTTEEIKRRLTRTALETIDARRESIRWEGTVIADEPYSGGLVLLWFLHETLGDASVRKILASHQATFAAAFREVTGAEPAALRDGLWKWMDQKLGR